MAQAEADGGGTWRSLMYAPHSFDASAAEFWPALLTGGEVVAAAPGNLDLAALAQTIVTEKIDVAQFTPTLFALLADHAPAALGQLFMVTTGANGSRRAASSAWPTPARTRSWSMATARPRRPWPPPGT